MSRFVRIVSTCAWPWLVASRIARACGNQDHSQSEGLGQDLIRCTWTKPAAQVCCELLLHLSPADHLSCCLSGSFVSVCVLAEGSWPFAVFFQSVCLRCLGIYGVEGLKTFASSCKHQRRHATCGMKGIEVNDAPIKLHAQDTEKTRICHTGWRCWHKATVMLRTWCHIMSHTQGMLRHMMFHAQEMLRYMVLHNVTYTTHLLC